MGCLFPLIALAMPRTTLFFIYLLTDWIGRAYKTTFWPFVGFLFMPFTTLAYMAVMLNNDHQLSGFWIVLIVFAILADFSQTKVKQNERE